MLDLTNAELSINPLDIPPFFCILNARFAKKTEEFREAQYRSNKYPHHPYS